MINAAQAAAIAYTVPMKYRVTYDMTENTRQNRTTPKANSRISLINIFSPKKGVILGLAVASVSESSLDVFANNQGKLSFQKISFYSQTFLYIRLV